MAVSKPVGRWWLTYENGEVWPCEVLRPSLFNLWLVKPVAPAPDAGTERIVVAARINDSAFHQPRVLP